MRIVHICNYFESKLGYQEYFLARQQARMGHSVVVVTSDRYFPYPNYEDTVASILGQRIIGPGIQSVDGFQVWRLRTTFEISTRVWLVGLTKSLRKLSPDLVICHGLTNFNSLRVLRHKKELGFQLVFDDHTVEFVSRQGPFGIAFYWSLRRFLIKSMIARADKIVSISSAVTDFLHKRLGIGSEQLTMIGLGADTERFYFDTTIRDRVRSAYQLGNDDLVVIFTGKLIRRKGVHMLLNLLNTVRSERIVWLLAVGSGEPAYVQKLRDIPLEPKRRFLHVDAVPNDQLNGFYCASDVAVWPCEPTISTLEAMACSLPIICNEELVERYERGNGFGVRAGDEDQILAAVQYLIDHPDDRKRMGEMGRRVVLEQFSWKVIAERFTQLAANRSP